jgi:hypothetical protein
MDQIRNTGFDKNSDFELIGKRSPFLNMSLSNGGVLALGAGPRAVRVPGQHGADQGVQVCSNNNNRLYGCMPQGCKGTLQR